MMEFLSVKPDDAMMDRSDLETIPLINYSPVSYLGLCN